MSEYMSVGGRWRDSTLNLRNNMSESMSEIICQNICNFFVPEKYVRIYVSWSYSMSDLLENT